MSDSSVHAPGTRLPMNEFGVLGWPAQRKIMARFVPKRIDDLRPEMAPFIGATCEWSFSGTSGDDEPFPGQWRWTPLPEEWGFWWAPDEDLELCLESMV
jgi:hypothetical protein